MSQEEHVSEVKSVQEEKCCGCCGRQTWTFESKPNGRFVIKHNNGDMSEMHMSGCPPKERQWELFDSATGDSTDLLLMGRYELMKMYILRDASTGLCMTAPDGGDPAPIGFVICNHNDVDQQWHISACKGSPYWLSLKSKSPNANASADMLLGQDGSVNSPTPIEASANAKPSKFGHDFN